MLYTVFLRSDTAATIYFTVCSVRLLFEGGVYFFAIYKSIAKYIFAKIKTGKKTNKQEEKQSKRLEWA